MALRACFTARVFIGTEIRLEVGFTTARARMADLAAGGLLEGVSQQAYHEWAAGLARVGPLGAAPGVSRLVQVNIRTLAQRDDSALWAMRWQATGTTGSLFPALDADLKLTPAAPASEASVGQTGTAESGGTAVDASHGATILAVSGVYRPPLGGLGASLDRVVMNRIARASIRAFARQLAAVLTSAQPQLDCCDAGPVKP